MTKFGWLVVVGVLLVMGGIAAFIYFLPKSAPTPVPTEEVTENLEGQSIYASGEYGFTLRYPSKATIEEAFTPSYIVGTSWRANAVATGTPLLAVINYTTESDHSFPRNYTAMVRIGVSVDEVEDCEEVTPDRGETALPDREINGTTWKAFSFGDAAMMKYVKGVSYRDVHNGTCYALEKIATGSSYMDDEDSVDDVSQDTLDAEYAALDAIVETFSFSR